MGFWRSGRRAAVAGTRSRPRAQPPRAPDFQDQAADPSWCRHGGHQAHIGAHRHATEHNLIHADLVEQAEHLLGVEVHPMNARMTRLVAAAMTQKVESTTRLPRGPARQDGELRRAANHATRRAPSHRNRRPRRPAGTGRRPAYAACRRGLVPSRAPLPRPQGNCARLQHPEQSGSACCRSTLAPCHVVGTGICGPAVTQLNGSVVATTTVFRDQPMIRCGAWTRLNITEGISHAGVPLPASPLAIDDRPTIGLDRHPPCSLLMIFGMSRRGRFGDWD